MINKQNLQNAVTRIIVLSHYEIECEGNRGKTGKEISEFEERAIKRYQGVAAINDVITSSMFHNRVDRDVARIMRAIEESV